MTIRDKESKILLDAFNSKQAEFIVLYGRRRIGKTFLIEQFSSKQKACFFHVTGIKDAPMKEQLSEFSDRIGEAFYQGARIAPQNTWLEAFKDLSRAIEASLPKNKKIIVFLDELPWLCTKRSRLIQAIEYYWNRFWKNDARIKLIICGSSASWIINKIINNKGGLHNRYTQKILLKPFTLIEAKKFLEERRVNLNYHQVVNIYMATGGVPYYLNYVKRGLSYAQVIDDLCFQKNGILYDEFDKLFESLFEDAQIYKEIIRSVAKKRHGLSLSDIEKNCEKISSGGTLTKKLKELEDAAFIKEFMPLGHKRQGKYYRISDEYCYFYLQWIEPLKNELSLDNDDNRFWTSYIGTPEYYNWQGYSFESICYKHLNQIRQALNIHTAANIGTWRYIPTKTENKKGAQIDLLFDRRDSIVTICEIKYTEKPFLIDKSYIENIQNKISLYKSQTRSKKHISIVFISASGIKENIYSENNIDQVVTIDCLFK